MRNKGSLRAKKILVIALPLLSEEELQLVQGVRESLGKFDHEFEVMVLSGGYEASLRKLAEQEYLAGAIGEFMSPLWMKSLLDKKLPLVHLGSAQSHAIPSVSVDFEMIGEEAARVLIGSGVKSLGYLGASGPSGAAILGKSFASYSRGQGLEPLSSNEFSRPVLKDFIQSLPRPAGLFCATDRLARLAILAAQEAGISIPFDLAVIGVGNSRMESLHAGIDISSFETPFHEIGRKAGNFMVQLIQGIPITESSASVRAILHERESSIRFPSGVARAIAYLRSNPDTQMNAGELASFAGMSRRSFENALLAECGQSPGSLLQKMRQTRAEQFLAESNLSISAIGRSCGYIETAVFSTAFKRWTGKSPRAYRSAFGIGSLKEN